MRIKSKGIEEIGDAVVRLLRANCDAVGARFIQRAGQAAGCNRADMRKRIGPGGRLDGPTGSFLELAQAHEGHGACAKHAEEHRVEGAQTAGVIGEFDGRSSIAGLRLDKRKRVVAQREVRAQVNCCFQLDDGLIVLAPQPQGPAHSPVRGGITIVGHQAVPGCLERPVDLPFALRPALEGVVEMGERKAGVGTRKGRVETHSHLEEMPGLIIIDLVEAIYVPQPAVMRLPRVERGRRPQDCAIALEGLDLVGDGRDDPVANSSSTTSASRVL